MAKIVVTFDEIGGIEEFNGLSVALATSAIINKAADYLVEVHGPHFDEAADYTRVSCDFVRRRVVFEIKAADMAMQDAALDAVLSKVLQDSKMMDVFQRLGTQ